MWTTVVQFSFAVFPSLCFSFACANVKQFHKHNKKKERIQIALYREEEEEKESNEQKSYKLLVIEWQTQKLWCTECNYRNKTIFKQIVYESYFLKRLKMAMIEDAFGLVFPLIFSSFYKFVCFKLWFTGLKQ